jgi:hypothetical protein
MNTRDETVAKNKTEREDLVDRAEPGTTAHVR